MELFGPSSWLQGMYLAALKAASEIADYLGETDKAAEYTEIFNSGYNYTKNNLFNGEYFIQEVDLKDKSILEHFGFDERYWNEETNEIKYQIANGSSIDQLLGLWHAKILGLGEIFDVEQVKTALKNMFKYNYKSSMRDFTNPWRIFSLNDEAGTVICEYPNKDKKPSIPISYCEETMTGFEYSFAGLLAEYGMIDESLQVIKAVRERFDGKKRNPWNEIECGNNYARSMSSFALLTIFSGFEFDIPHNHIGFNPKVNKENYKSCWFVDSAWGNFSIENNVVLIEILEGKIDLSSIGLKFANKIRKLLIDDIDTEFCFEKGNLNFEKQTLYKTAKIILET